MTRVPLLRLALSDGRAATLLPSAASTVRLTDAETPVRTVSYDIREFVY